MGRASRCSAYLSARHTFASLALDAGKSIRFVADQLGHESPSFTPRPTPTCCRWRRATWHSRTSERPKATSMTSPKSDGSVPTESKNRSESNTCGHEHSSFEPEGRGFKSLRAYHFFQIRFKSLGKSDKHPIVSNNPSLTANRQPRQLFREGSPVSRSDEIRAQLRQFQEEATELLQSAGRSTTGVTSASAVLTQPDSVQPVE